MSSWHTYPSLFNLGHGAIKELFNGPITVQEKIDGSQFSFGLIDGVLRCRSKGKELDLDHPEKMFTKAVEFVRSVQYLLTPGYTYRGEFLGSPKHNTLAYERAPKNHIILFDINVNQEQYLGTDDVAAEAARLGLEVVPCLGRTSVPWSLEQINKAMDRISCLGGAKIEGIVFKNYNQFGADKKVLMGKHVSEEFKEIHKKDWKVRAPGSNDILEILGDKYRTAARWQKAVQHLREAGKLTDSPKDIGALMAEVKEDIFKECSEEIGAALLSWARHQMSSKWVMGLPQWYKDELAKKQFEVSNEIDSSSGVDNSPQVGTLPTEKPSESQTQA